MKNFTIKIENSAKKQAIFLCRYLSRQRFGVQGVLVSVPIRPAGVRGQRSALPGGCDSALRCVIHMVSNICTSAHVELWMVNDSAVASVDDPGILKPCGAGAGDHNLSQLWERWENCSDKSSCSRLRPGAALRVEANLPQQHN